MILIAFHDFKYRAVPLFLLIGLFIMGLFIGMLSQGYVPFIKIFIINFAILLFMILLVTAYFMIRYKKGIKGVIDNYIGLADLIVLLSAGTFFSPFNYINFIIFSLLIALFIYIPIIIIKRQIKYQIPLAGIFMIILSVFFTFSFKIGLNLFFDDYFLINYLKLTF